MEYSGGGGGSWNMIPNVPTYSNPGKPSSQDHLYLQQHQQQFQQQQQQQPLLLQQQQQQQQQQHQSLASHFHLFHLVEKLSDSTENGTRDPQSDALASMSLKVFDRDAIWEVDAFSLRELEETHGRLEKQKKDREYQKAQHYAAMKSKKAIHVIPKLVGWYKARKCTKEGRLQRKIHKLKNNEHFIEVEIQVRKGLAKKARDPSYDASPVSKKSAVKSLDEEDLATNNDELKETIHQINRKIKYMQLKSIAKFGSQLKNNLSKRGQSGR